MASPQPLPPPLGIQELLKKALQDALHQQELQLDARFDNVVAEYHEARAKFEQLKQECEQLHATLAAQQQTITHTQRIIILKQEAINRLLPSYPHAITPELQYRIEAA